MPALLVLVAAVGCGSDGDTGPVGPIGPSGDNGDPGADGIAGENGTNGAACWDLDANGVCDVATEDIDGDGACSAADCAGTSVGTIEVTVTDIDELAVEGATVTTIPESIEVDTDASGKATLADISMGVYTVYVRKSGYKAFSESMVSVVANGLAKVDGVLGEGADYTLISLEGISGARGDTDTMAGTRATLTAGNNNTIITTGLRNVGVGNFVYVTGADVDEEEEAITAWSWTVEGPFLSKAALEYTDTPDASQAVPRTFGTTPSRWARFRPDLPGIYAVTMTGTTAGGDVTSTINIYAGNYVGQQACAGCHSNPDVVGETRAVYDSFLQTGHATKFISFFNRYSASGDYCVPCHVTGYDESAPNGGFDDALRLAGWDPASDGSAGAFFEANYWDAVAGSADIFAFLADPMTQPAQKIMNIQCEACHGPGSNHPTAENHITWSPGVCKQCHPQPNQWSLSGHNLKPPEHMAGSASCVGCHTGQGFVVVQDHGDAAVFPDDATEEIPATMFEPGNAQPIGCPTCHDPHKASYPYSGSYGDKSDQLRFEGEVVASMGNMVEAEKSAVCVKCHSGRRDQAYLASFLAGNESRATHHNVQALILEGTGGAEYTGKTYTRAYHKAAIEEKCIGCHMSTAGTGATCDAANPCANPAEVCSHGVCAADKYGAHTFNMTWVDPSSDIEYEHVDACTDCHSGLTEFGAKTLTGATGDGFDCDAATTGAEAEVDNMLDKVRACLVLNPALDNGSGDVITSGIKDAGASAAELRAIWNYHLVADDGSHGLHNAGYAMQLLRDAYDDLGCTPALSCTRP